MNSPKVLFQRPTPLDSKTRIRIIVIFVLSNFLTFVLVKSFSSDPREEKALFKDLVHLSVKVKSHLSVQAKQGDPLTLVNPKTKNEFIPGYFISLLQEIEGQTLTLALDRKHIRPIVEKSGSFTWEVYPPLQEMVLDKGDPLEIDL